MTIYHISYVFVDIVFFKISEVLFNYLIKQNHQKMHSITHYNG